MKKFILVSVIETTDSTTAEELKKRHQEMEEKQRGDEIIFTMINEVVE